MSSLISLKAIFIKYKRQYTDNIIINITYIKLTEYHTNFLYAIDALAFLANRRRGEGRVKDTTAMPADFRKMA